MGAVIAPPLIALILAHGDWFGLASWRWVFFVTGAFGLAWAVWRWATYATPDVAPDAESAAIEQAAEGRAPSLGALLRKREVLGISAACMPWVMFVPGDDVDPDGAVPVQPRLLRSAELVHARHDRAPVAGPRRVEAGFAAKDIAAVIEPLRSVAAHRQQSTG